MIEEFSKAKNKSSRLQVLTKYGDIRAFTDILRGTFDDSLQFNLPEGKPPYTPNIKSLYPSSLLKLHRNFGLFVKGGALEKICLHIEESLNLLSC